MNSKRRCVVCRNYYPPEEMRVVSVSSICSDECLRTHSKPKPPRVRPRKTATVRRLPTALRESIRTRDKKSCRFCGRSTGRMEIHHIEYRSQGGADVAHNLILLCEDHHRLVHSSKRYWQPILRAVIWMHYVGRISLTIPEAERRFAHLIPGLELQGDLSDASE